MSNRWTLEILLARRAAGLSLIPVSAQTKRPIEKLLPQDPDTGKGSWKPYMLRLATEAELTLWLREGAEFAVVCGAASGGLVAIDFDITNFYPPWAQAVGSLAAGLVVQQTGGGGLQLLLRCPNPGGNQKLAWEPSTSDPSGRVIAIETRGEGGYAVLAPSLHPSGRYYELLEGDFTQIPLLSQAHADALLDAARKLCEAPYTTQQLAAMQAAMSQPSRHANALNGQAGAIDAYNQATPIEDALQTYGYVWRGGHRWSRPGGENPSVEVQSGKSFHHNTNDPFCDGHWHDAFDLFCFYEHGGHASSAARAAATILCLPPLQPSPTPSASTQAAPASPPPSTPPPPATAAPVQPTPAQLQALTDANMTHTGNAECLVALYGDQLRYCHSRKTWLTWDGQRWKDDRNGLAFRLATEMARQRYLAAGLVAGLHKKDLASWAIRSENVNVINATLVAGGNHDMLKSTIDDYDQDPFLASTPAGTLNLLTGYVQAPRQNDYLSMQLGVAYDAQAQCPRFLQFLDEIFEGDRDLIAFVQRAFGYSLTGDIREQRVFFLWGLGANGKSLLLKIAEWLLGEYAGNASFQTFDPERRSKIGEDVAALKGKRLVTIIETSEDRRLDEARLKSLSGNDSITCRFLHGNPFTYQPTFKIWVAMNHLPAVRGTDTGIWRRIMVVPFRQTFAGREDKTLAEKLRQELPGILNWALEGLRAWHHHGLGSCTTVEEASEQYRKDSDQLGQWLAEETIDDPKGMLPSSDAYQLYNLWAKNRGERYPLTQNAWGRALKDRGYKTIDPRPRIAGKITTAYGGIRMREDTDPDPSATPAGPTPAAAPATAPAPKTDYDYNKQRIDEARALVKQGKYAKAREKAASMRGGKSQRALESWIERVEKGEITADEPIA